MFRLDDDYVVDTTMNCLVSSLYKSFMRSNEIFNRMSGKSSTKKKKH